MSQAVSFLPRSLRVHQGFGAHPEVYKQFGLAGHNGLDFDARTGTALIAPLPGVWHLVSEQRIIRTSSFPFVKKIWYGYGAAWRLDWNRGNGLVTEFLFAHLQDRRKEYDGKNLDMALKMAECDNTGFSTGPHLHLTVKDVYYKNGWREVVNYRNGYFGAYNPIPLLHSLGLSIIT